MVFMVVMTVWALILLVFEFKNNTVGIIAAALMVLAILLIIEAVKTIKKLKAIAGI
jgi:hypothetical protein